MPRPCRAPLPRERRVLGSGRKPPPLVRLRVPEARLWGLSSKDEPADVRPELGERVGPHAAHYTQPYARAHITHRALTLGPPGAGERAAAGNCNESGIGRHQVAIAIPCKKRHLEHVSQSILERSTRIAKISWIFAPDGAQTRFHGAAHRSFAPVGARSLAKAIPMRSKFGWPIPPGPDPRAENFANNSLRSEGIADDPPSALLGCDGAVIVAPAHARANAGVFNRQAVLARCQRCGY